MKPDLFVRWHLGLGDAIICNGLVRALVARDEWQQVIVTAKLHNHASVVAMFADEPRIKVWLGDDRQSDFNADGMEKRGWPVLRLGMFGRDFDRRFWAQSFYRQAGVPQEDRWARFKVGDWGVQEQVPYDFYAAYHDCGSIGTAKIDPHHIEEDVHVGLVPKTATLWQWRDVLQNAESVHCIDSSVACLVDHLPENGQRLVLHRYARNSVPPDYRRRWEVLA